MKMKDRMKSCKKKDCKRDLAEELYWVEQELEGFRQFPLATSRNKINNKTVTEIKASSHSVLSLTSFKNNKRENKHKTKIQNELKQPLFSARHLSSGFKLLLIILIILISVFYFLTPDQSLGSLFSSRTAPESRGLFSFFERMGGTFTGAVISILPVEENPIDILPEKNITEPDCYNQTVCVNETTEECVESTEPACTSKIVESCTITEICDDVVNETIVEPVKSSLGTMELGIMALPSVSNVKLNSTNPANNNTNQNLTLYFDAADEDNDPVKNITNWYVDENSMTILNMPFENNTANVSNNTKDYSGFVNNGTVFGGTFWNATGGYDGKGAYKFDGKNDYVTVPDTASLSGLTRVTLSVWFKPNKSPVSGNGGIYYESTTTSGYTGFAIFHMGPGADVGEAAACLRTTAAGSSYCVYSGTPLTNGQWYHLVSTYNSTHILFYVNGTYLGATATDGGDISSGNPADAIGIGAYTYSVTPSYINGTIDEVMIFNRSLSAAQILALYNNRTDLIVSQETDRNEIWQACVTPNDGTGDGAEICSNNVTIINNIPVVSNVKLNSTDPLRNDTNQNLTLYYSVSEADDEPVKNITNWYVNGTSIAILNMPFEGIDSTTSNNAWDYSGFGNNASEINGATWSATAGHDGKGAYVFDGSNDYLNFSSQINIVNTNWTITFWAKPDSTTTLGTEATSGLGCWNARATNQYVFIPVYVAAGGITRVAVSVGTNGVTVCEEHDAFSPFILVNGTTINGWAHVAVRNDNNNITLYLNGEYIKDAQYTNKSRHFVANVITSSGTYKPFDGTLDDIIVFNRSLSAEQIKALSENKTDLIVANETSPGDNWSACITSNDGYDNGITVCSNNLTVLAVNNIPNTTSVLVNSSSLTNYTNESISCYANITDADGGNVYANYSWYKNGVLNVTGLSSAFAVENYGLAATIHPDNTTKGENWTCGVRGYDSIDYETDENNATVMIRYSSVYISSIKLNSTDPTRNDSAQNLTLYWNFTDNDPGIVKNITNWYVNGSSITVLNMPFENQTKDYSGYGYNGTPSGVTWNSTGGYDGKGAYEFSSINNYIGLGMHPNTLINGGSFTVEVHAKANKLSSNQVTYGAGLIRSMSGGGAGVGEFFLSVDDGGSVHFANWRSAGADADGMSYTADGLVTVGTWYHIVATWDGVVNKIYVNGTEVSIIGTESTSTGWGIASEIGRCYTTAGYVWNGSIDEVRIYNRSLSAAQVYNLFINKTNQIASSELAVGNNWTACVTPNDGTSEGTLQCSNIVTILVNRIPTVNAVKINSSGLNNYSSESISCYANITDQDNSTVYANYTWYKNGVLDLAGLSSTFATESFGLASTVLAGNLSRGENWSCIIKAYDGANFGTEDKNATIFILNSPPLASNLVLNSTDPTTNNTNQNLTFYWSITESDNDPVKNITNWRLNSTSITLLHMLFERSNGSSNNAIDYSEFGNNGTARGATWNATGGYDNLGAYQFDGINDNITTLLALTPTQANSSSRTIMTWFKLVGNCSGASLSNCPLVCNSPSSSYSECFFSGIIFNANTGHVLCTLGYDSAYRQIDAGAISKNQWNHLAYVFDASTRKGYCYLNGVQQGTYTNFGAQLDQGVGNGLYYISSTYSTMKTYFNGTIDEVMVFNRSLSAEQIYNIYVNRTKELASNETAVGNNWSACVTPNDGEQDGPTACSNVLTITNSTGAAENARPPAPVLLLPENGNATVNRTPILVWNNSVDPEDDVVTYNLLIDDNSNFNNPEVNVSAIANTTFVNTTYYLGTVLTEDVTYFWKVYANDSGGYSADNSSVRNFTVQSYLAVSLLNDAVEFGSLLPNVSDNTSDKIPPPFWVENAGNIISNVTITATLLFTSVDFPSSNYQFRIEANESDAFNTTLSTMVLTNINTSSATKHVIDLNWLDISDDFLTGLAITVPNDEPSGVKSSTVTFTIER